MAPIIQHAFENIVLSTLHSTDKILRLMTEAKNGY
jgi:hypothetical protein